MSLPFARGSLGGGFSYGAHPPKRSAVGVPSNFPARTPAFATCCILSAWIGVLFGCFDRQIDEDSWFTWWINHLPGPSISPKRTPCGLDILVTFGFGPFWWQTARTFFGPSTQEVRQIKRRHAWQLRFVGEV